MINLVRIVKKLYLLIELLRISRIKQTESYENIEEQSIFKWKFKFPVIQIPHGKWVKVFGF